MTREQESAIETLGITALEDRTVRIADVRQHPAFRGLPEHHLSILSFLAVPVRHKGRSIGNLYLANKLGAPEFSREDERAVELDVAVLDREGRRTGREAAEQERRRRADDAREVVDSVRVFDRLGRAVTLTEAGRLLEEQAARITTTLAAMRRSISGMRPQFFL